MWWLVKFLAMEWFAIQVLVLDDEKSSRVRLETLQDTSKIKSCQA